MNYYIFNVALKNSSNLEVIHTVVFDSKVPLDKKVFIKEYKAFLSYNLPSEVFIYIKPSNFNPSDLIVHLNNLKQTLIINFNEIGIEHSASIPASWIDSIKEKGLLDIFTTNNGILQSEDSYHYILPSGKHSKYFIRVGNTLCLYPHISFYAIWMLKYINKEFKKIYYDSSSILSIISVLLSLKRYFSSDYYFELENFNSYYGLHDTDFDRNSLVIISASNSGDIANEIKNINEGKNIETLFIVLNVKEPSHNFIINLYGKHDALIDRQYKHEGECDFCSNNSIPVKISGEQFLPVKTKIKSVIFKEIDLPEKTKRFLKDFAGKNIFKCNYYDRVKNREIFLDLSKYHESFDLNNYQDDNNNCYISEWTKYLENNIPINIPYIVHLADPSSKQIALQLKEYIIKRHINHPNIISFNNTELSIPINTEGAIIVIASSIASGNRLYRLSTKLRDIENASIHYLTCISRTEDEKKSKFLKSNLEFRKAKNKKNIYVAILEINLPDNHSRYSNKLLNTPWEKEKEFIVGIFKNNDPPEFIIDRENKINNIQNNDSLFWHNPMNSSKSSLSIRKNFAFFDFEELGLQSDKIQQSEVYFVILSMIHNVRNRKENKNIIKLEQHEHVRTLISPYNFSRYNDGIIQACILRAARPSELDYSISEEYSHEALSIFINIFKGKDPINAEAILEFLYALAIKKLRLIIGDLKQLIQVFDEEYKDIEEVDYFINYIKTDLK